MDKSSLRKYISVGLALSFLLILVSGTVLYIAPPGAVARWINWIMLGLSRAQWETQHTLFSYLFILFALVHLFLINWKTFISYLIRRISFDRKSRRESWLALITILGIFFMTLFELPPVITVMDIGNRISAKWEENIGSPPAPGIEDIELDELADRFFESDSDSVMEQIRSAGYKASDPRQSLKEVAKENDVAPMLIFRSIGLTTTPD